MARPFTPRDALRVWRTQPGCTCLEIEDAVLVARSPLRQAIDAFWRPGAAHVRTFVLSRVSSGACDGFVQLRLRRATPSEADLVYVAPALVTTDGSALLWQSLVAGACQHIVASGVERVFVAVGEDDDIALHVLRRLGFSVVTSDVVFACVDATPAVAPPAPERSIEARAEDVLAVRRLMHDALPEAARLAGGTWGDDWLDYPVGGHAPGATSSRVCLDPRGDVCGAWRIVGGRAGAWLRVVARPGADVASIVGDALRHGARSEIAAAGRLHATARGYETELHLALRDHGFEPQFRRFRLVRHLAARVLSPAWQPPAVRGRDLRHVPSSSVESSSRRCAGPTVATERDVTHA